MPSYLITGASRGIGLEFIKQLSASNDNTVFAVVRNTKTATGLQEIGRKNVHILEADITDHKTLKAAAAEVSKVTGGKLDVLINNAALVSDERQSYLLDGYDGEEELLEKDLRTNFEVNVIGVVHTINAFLPLVRAGTLKQVITVSSGVGDLDFTDATEFPYLAPYSISKAAVNMVVAKYAVQYKKEGLVFLAISPGLVNTQTKPPTPEQMKFFQTMAGFFGKVAPPDFKGMISPTESVEMMLKVFSGLSEKDSGAFISHKGSKEWL